MESILGVDLGTVRLHEGWGAAQSAASLGAANCGWIDWGHAIPDAARQLIFDVRRASATLNKEHDAIAKIEPPGEHIVDPGVPGKRLKDECPTGYDRGEIEAARVSMLTMKIAGPPGEPPLTVLGNFNVDSAITSSSSDAAAVTQRENRPGASGGPV